ncbi:hypothetical protein PAXRUDRAFT_173704 [Paxillus rubicundulus Ve08.2h10]|uniref:Uncharacterized protein n=1 Tax=Paxillus rubicundulus Ve08.2h10 TaxID=930991 RepID=A0A0D0CIW7_9AGAM|nr:hypothetical protein PAXRUDRAFT_173704 [Paxillus rubicundulus Ve08.2h10]
MVNHSTPFHRDHNNRVQWYDLLASIGTYVSAWFKVPTLGTACYYPPRSVIAVSGLLVRHGVGPTEGNHLCFVSYMRDNVHQAMGVQRSDWVCYCALPALWAGNV